MKIFLSYIETIHKDKHEENVRRIKKILDGIRGVKVFEYKIVKSDTEDKSSHISEALQSSDIFIGEMSRPSQTLGFLLGQAINQKKPCLYIYDDSTQGKPRNTIQNHPSRLLLVQHYQQNQLKKILTNFLRKAEKQLLSDRITFVCSKAAREYIDRQSTKFGLAKGEIIRTIIEEKMNYDET